MIKDNNFNSKYVNVPANNISIIQFVFIYVQTEQPRNQLQTEHEYVKDKKI
jgi:hypothetical protein